MEQGKIMEYIGTRRPSRQAYRVGHGFRTDTETLKDRAGIAFGSKG